MRRVGYHEYGGPEVLRVEEVEVPQPGPGQVQVRAEAIGANYIDTVMRRGGAGGYRFPLPGTPTGDVVGTVTALGADVRTVRVGERVAGLAEAAFADYVVTDAQWVAPVADGVSDGVASMLAMAVPVALGVLRMGGLAAGESVLVHAAAGGIGHQLVQLAKLRGAGTVVAAASSAEKLAVAAEFGADAGVDYAEEDWPDRLRAVLPGGVDVIADSAGGQTSLRGLAALAPLGRAVFYGMTSGAFADIPPASVLQVKSVAGFSLLAFRAARPEQARADVEEGAALAAQGRLRTTVHATFPLAEAAAAHALLESRRHTGRVLLVP